MEVMAMSVKFYHPTFLNFNNGGQTYSSNIKARWPMTFYDRTMVKPHEVIFWYIIGWHNFFGQKYHVKICIRVINTVNS